MCLKGERQVRFIVSKQAPLFLTAMMVFGVLVNERCAQKTFIFENTQWNETIFKVSGPVHVT